MTQIRIKRVYEKAEAGDGHRILIDRLWPRGIKKEDLKYDRWEKDITPSPALRSWFHKDKETRWNDFADLYKQELNKSAVIETFIEEIRKHPAVTLLYASKEPIRNHAIILQEYLREFV